MKDPELKYWKIERRFYRQVLVCILSIPILSYAVWWVSQHHAYLALSLFAILSGSALVGYLVWKGWIEKPPSGA